MMSIILALIMLESGGDPNAVGDHGKAAGILQIHEEVIVDVNRRYRTKYRWPEDAFNPTTAIEICRLYLTMYHRKGLTPVQIARIWNGGPTGHWRRSTLVYGKRFAKHFNPAGFRAAEKAIRLATGGTYKTTQA